MPYLEDFRSGGPEGDIDDVVTCLYKSMTNDPESVAYVRDVEDSGQEWNKPSVKYSRG